jgi:hypothetical protein
MQSKRINIQVYKLRELQKHNPTITISVAQSALDRNCPRLKEILHKKTEHRILNGRQAGPNRQDRILNE